MEDIVGSKRKNVEYEDYNNEKADNVVVLVFIEDLLNAKI